MGDGDYRPRPKVHFAGRSLPALMRALCATRVEGVDCRTGQTLTGQKPRYRYPFPDTARLRAPEWVRRYLRVVRRAR